MADFRKWFLVVAVVLLTAASASAQQSFAMPCNMTGQTQIIRVGGVTEPVGEIDLACDSTQLTPLGASVTAQWTLQVNATITNAVNDDGSGKTMAAVAVQYNRAPFAIQHMVRGVPAGPPGILQFPNVVLPTGTTFTMRFFNVRVSALTLVNPPSSPGGYPEVVGLVTANAFNPSGWSVTFPQTVAPVLIGQVVQDFNFAVTACDGSTPAPSVALQQCVDYVLNPGPFPGFKAAPVFGVTFTEANSLSFSEFKNLIEEDLATIPNPSAPAAAGFPAATDDPLVCDTAHDGTGTVSVMSDVPPIEPCNGQPAWVSNGTKLVAKFTLDQRLVGKLHIWVTEFPTHASAKANAELQVVGNPNAWGSGGFTEGPRVTQCGPGGNHWVLLTDDAQTKVAGWEITSDDFSGIDTLTFGVAITYTESQIPSLPAGSTYDPIVIAGNIGPIDPLAAAMRVLGQVPAKAPVVRFAHPDIPGSVQPTIQHCVTNLLFPYVTNIVGFETGIAISNTSLDTAWNLTDPPSEPGAGTGVVANWGAEDNPQPYNTTPQSGPCNLYLFGSNQAVTEGAAGSAVMAIASATTPNILAGQVFADTLGSIFNLGGGTTPITLSGYVIARCEFQFGHGYAYIVSPGGVPQSYLGLVIPDRNILNGDTSTGFTSTPIRIAQPFSNAIFDEQGEVLAQ